MVFIPLKRVVEAVFIIKKKGNVACYRKLISANFVLNRCENVLPINVRRLIYNSLIQSHLEYGVLAWGSSKNKLITSINKMQKRCIRNLVSGNWLSHTDPLYGKLNILKFNMTGRFGG